MRRKLLFLFPALGLIAPAIWWFEYSRGHYVVPGSFLEKVIPFFPSSLLFIGIPEPPGVVGIVIVVIACLANMALYLLLGWLGISLLSLLTRLMPK